MFHICYQMSPDNHYREEKGLLLNDLPRTNDVMLREQLVVGGQPAYTLLVEIRVSTFANSLLEFCPI